MKKLKTALLASALGLSFIFAGSATASTTNATQIVPVTKRVSKKVYKKGRWVTVSTWKGGKRVTKKVWRKSNSIGHKVAGKTRDIVMGPKKPTP